MEIGGRNVEMFRGGRLNNGVKGDFFFSEDRIHRWVFVGDLGKDIGRVSLGVHIDQQRFPPANGEGRAEVDR